MAKYPVESTDTQGVIDAVNYVLSGPAGLGQDFQGFSSTVDPDTDPPVNILGFMTGNYRPPFTSTSGNTFTYVAPVAFSTCEFLDARTIRYNFTTSQASPPFALGNPIEVIAPGYPEYEGRLKPVGVVECTVDYVIARITGDGTVPAPGGGGTISYDAFGGYAYVSTDCNAKANVLGGTDRVFISAQLNNVIHYTCTEPSAFEYVVMINRRVAYPNNDPTNPDYVYGFDKTISARTYYYQVDAGTGTIPLPFAPGYYQYGQDTVETIFASVFDAPGLGYYWYLIELEINNVGGDVVIEQCELSNRSLSVQVVKQ